MQPFLLTPTQSSIPTSGVPENLFTTAADSPTSPEAYAAASSIASSSVQGGCEEGLEQVPHDNVTIRTVFNVAQSVLPYCGYPYREIKEIFADIVEFARLDK